MTKRKQKERKKPAAPAHQAPPPQKPPTPLTPPVPEPSYPKLCTKVVIVPVCWRGRFVKTPMHCDLPSVGGDKENAWCEEHSKPSKSEEKE